ncbi:hypothetical protein LTR37_011445 [Vermiconidia calcicola]|uniref:Uncharacterized protein n=1 Tax=Vermiconidia calcicola TaxID=1690605 RepID=A0ACC3N269_9PEZI|nr:hypothetical protein LTR37_011445 [Vermiconidia calcicola]
MDDPAEQISNIIYKLTTGVRGVQQETVEKYFTPNASFKHPFCTVNGDRTKVLRIYQWYKILSPHIRIRVNSVAYDETKATLYVNISQLFKLWFVPFYRAPVNLTTVLELVKGQDLNDPKPISRSVNRPARYYIASQNDLYQVDQFVRFFTPLGTGVFLVGLWHWVATLVCVWGAWLLGPLQPILALIFAPKEEYLYFEDVYPKSDSSTPTMERDGYEIELGSDSLLYKVTPRSRRISEANEIFEREHS